MVRPDWPAVLLWVAAQVVVPLALRHYPAQPLHRLVPPAAALLGAAHLLPRGVPSALLTLPWLALTLGLAMHARGVWPAERLARSAALVFLPVGAAWAAMSRADVTVLHFPSVIVQMTGLHFHYAGFALSVLASLLAERTRTPLDRAAAVAVVAGMPLVAAGITFWPLLEWLGAWFMAASAALVGVRQVLLPGPLSARVLWTVSGLCLVGGMSLAVVYARQEYLGLGNLGPMLRWHSTLNSLGFSLLGLLGWRCVRVS
ncbi:MAG: YndJ family transporter [Candidatus Eremiobacterota bacterium]